MADSWQRLLVALDPSRDAQLEEFSTEELGEIIGLFIKILGQEERSHLEYVVRNLRRRVLYCLTPKKLLSKKSDAFEILRDIENDLRKVLGPETVEPVARSLRQVIIELYWRERDYDSTEFMIKLVRQQGPYCQLCGYRFRSADTDISELKDLFSDDPYPIKSRYYDCLKPLSKKAKLRRPVIDHVVPLDSFGKDELSNYRPTCDQCNRGKHDFLSFAEPRFASGHRERGMLGSTHIKECQLFYAVVTRDRQCFKCNRRADQMELTLSPISVQKFIMFDTLRTVCYDCDEFTRRWKPLGFSPVDDEDDAPE